MNNETLNQPTEDAALAQQARSDGEAFAELYNRHVPRVYRYHMAHTGNVKDAEDLTSQTFMAAMEGIRSFRGEGSFAAWIMGIAVRKKALFFRGRRLEAPLEAARDVPTPGLPTDKAVLQHMQIESVARALRQISPDRGEALVLYFFGGLTSLEVSQITGKSEAAVKMLLSRGLKDLRERTSLTLEVEP
ncbi:MAG TPA: RNA polymerase sigma factor [Anaerolineales bacterium]